MIKTITKVHFSFDNVETIIGLLSFIIFYIFFSLFVPKKDPTRRSFSSISERCTQRQLKSEKITRFEVYPRELSKTGGPKKLKITPQEPQAARSCRIQPQGFLAGSNSECLQMAHVTCCDYPLQLNGLLLNHLLLTNSGRTRHKLSE